MGVCSKSAGDCIASVIRYCDGLIMSVEDKWHCSYEDLCIYRRA